MIRAAILIVLLGLHVTVMSAQDVEMPVIKLYLDADRTRHAASAESIEMGVRTAFAQVGNVVQGHKVDIVPLDHRGNSTRSRVNMNKAFSDPDTLLVVAGLHSPPLIKNRTYINDNAMLTLVPWAAGGPITRHPSADNWIFRLSVDDTKAGIKIAEYAVEQGQCSRPQLLLEKTPWGESNRKTMTRAIEDRLELTPVLTWFNWGVSVDNARIKLRAVVDGGSDCILFVGGSNDGVTFARAMLSMAKAQRRPIFSHWGLTGGNFAEEVTAQQRAQLDLTFIQTCFSFVSSEPSALSREVFLQAQSLYPELKTTKDLKAPPGFIHAYDISLLLIQALSQVELTEDMAVNRVHIKDALEGLEEPVNGLIKRYEKPFSVYSADNTDAHEALGLKDFCMAKYGSDDEIIVLNQR